MKSSGTFIANTHIFGKVYFPRLILPVSGLLASLVNFGIQLLLFILILVFYKLSGTHISPGWHLVLSPFILLIVSLYSLGVGMLISAFTTRYRDLTHFLAFGSQLLMYATPIIYPASIVPANFKWVTALNPLSAVFEAFRFSFLGVGEYDFQKLLLSFGLGLFVFFKGLVLFNKAERTSIDTV
jgi:lipopolysaccharide transport system permease protein